MRKIHRWSYISTLLCTVGLLVASFTQLSPSLHLIIFCASIIAFIVSVIGFHGITNGRTYLRAVIPLMISAGLIIFEGFVIFIGQLLT